MWLMLQQDEPEDYVIATGVAHTVREAVEVGFSHVGLDWTKHVIVDERFLRPAEVESLLGDAAKAERQLGWRPEVAFESLIRMMVDADLARLGD